MVLSVKERSKKNAERGTQQDVETQVRRLPQLGLMCPVVAIINLAIARLGISPAPSQLNLARDASSVGGDTTTSPTLKELWLKATTGTITPSLQAAALVCGIQFDGGTLNSNSVARHVHNTELRHILGKLENGLAVADLQSASDWHEPSTRASEYGEGKVRISDIHMLWRSNYIRCGHGWATHGQYLTHHTYISS